MACIFYITNNLAQLLHQTDVQMSCWMCKGAGSDFDDDAHGIHLPKLHF